LCPTGLLNKQVGGELGISEITVKAHRGRMMQRMQARTSADLVSMAAKLGVVGDLQMNIATGHAGNAASGE
jgi:FixJ family two-component response regulator